ncbi:MAG: primosomal protein N' [Deltaproteobacteria bacterium]|nr:primosomal protein N' [Deltaproteobacteria bacterium]
MAFYALVVVQEPRWSALTYALPPELTRQLTAGWRVRVPWGRAEKRGIIVSLHREPPANLDPGSIRMVLGTDGGAPLIDPASIELARWIARYYRCSIGQAVRLFIPPEGRDRQEMTVRLNLWDTPVIDLSELDGPASRLYEYLLEREARTPGRPLKLSGRAISGLSSGEMNTAVRDLAQMGIISASAGHSRGRIRERTVPVYSRSGTPVPSNIKLAPVALNILTALEHAPRQLALADLPGSPASRKKALAELERLGLVVPGQQLLPRVQPGTSAEAEKPPKPSPEQEQAIGLIQNDISRNGFQVTLLRGVTGSGKTEVYLRAIETALSLGRGALVIVPEIALTPQTASRFTARFPGQVAVLHSGLGAGERHDEWWRLRRGEARVIVGTRSALFAPLQDTGLIVVDEEHDSSFKQDTVPRYHARDTAVKKAQILKIPVVLGSATPSLETLDNAWRGRYRIVELTGRVAAQQMPSIQVVSLRKEDRTDYDRDRPWFLSGPAEKAIEQTLAAGEQAMIFLNRRGYSPVFPCLSCGHVPECPHCSIPMTYHHGAGTLACHYCGHETSLPRTCTACGGAEFDAKGLGTEQVEMALQSRFPGARIARLDRDSIRRKGTLHSILDRFRSREIDLLVGTQILAKGHDFPGVTLVVVVSADQALRIPDFRAEEKAAQLLAQVSGRAGRADRPGRVIVQTHEPEHPVIQWLQKPGDELWKRIREEREPLLYPPSGRLATVEISARNETAADRVARSLAGQWAVPAGVVRLGPATPPVGKLAGRYRRRFLLKGNSSGVLNNALTGLEQLLASIRERDASSLAMARITVDIDPQSLL